MTTTKELIRQKLQAAEHTVKQAWEAYEREVTIDGASEEVRAAFRRTFYAGAVSAYILTLVSAEPDSEAEGEARFEVLGDEIQAAVEEYGLLRGGK